MLAAETFNEVGFLITIGCLAAAGALVATCVCHSESVWRVITFPLRFVWPKKRPHKVPAACGDPFTVAPETTLNVDLVSENRALRDALERSAATNEKLKLALAGALADEKIYTSDNERLRVREKKYEGWLREANGRLKEMRKEESERSSRGIDLEGYLEKMRQGSPVEAHPTLGEDISFWRERIQDSLKDGKWDFDYRPPKPSVLVEIFDRFEGALEEQKEESEKHKANAILYKEMATTGKEVELSEAADKKQPEDQIDKTNRCSDPCSRPNDVDLLRQWKGWADECLKGSSGWTTWRGPLPKIVSRICGIGLKLMEKEKETKDSAERCQGSNCSYRRGMERAGPKLVEWEHVCKRAISDNGGVWGHNFPPSPEETLFFIERIEALTNRADSCSPKETKEKSVVAATAEKFLKKEVNISFTPISKLHMLEVGRWRKRAEEEISVVGGEKVPAWYVYEPPSRETVTKLLEGGKGGALQEHWKRHWKEENSEEVPWPSSFLTLLREAWPESEEGRNEV